MNTKKFKLNCLSKYIQFKAQFSNHLNIIKLTLKYLTLIRKQIFYFFEFLQYLYLYVTNKLYLKTTFIGSMVVFY